MPDRSMRYRFLGEDASLGKTMGGLGGQADKLHHSLGRLAGAFAGGIVGAGAVDFLKHSITDASDLNESLSKTRVVFGQASKGVEVFAKAAATGIGQSEQQALEATSTFGNLFRALGIGAKPAADLSVKIVKLAGDLASFNNTNPADALDALKSGLLGEVEPLRKYGVTLSQTRVEAEALADGIVRPVKDAGKVHTALVNVEVATGRLYKAQKLHGATSLEAKKANDQLTVAQTALAKATKGAVPQLTAAQKAQASYNIIMKDTKTAQGDFARTSGGLANQQRILKAEFADASAQLGTKLYPAATKVVGKLADALKPGSKFRDVLGDLGDRAKEFADDAKPIFTWIGDHPKLFTQIAKDAVILGGVLKATSFLKGLTGLGALTGKSAVGGVAGALGGIKAPVPVYVTNSGFGGPGGGKTPPVVSGGGKLGTVEKVGAAALAKRAFAGPVGGVGVVLLTSGDDAKGGSAKQQQKQFGMWLSKHTNIPGEQDLTPEERRLRRAALGTYSAGNSDKFSTKPDDLARYDLLRRYGKQTDPEVVAVLAKLASSPAVREHYANLGGGDLQQYRGQARGRTLAAPGTTADRVERITNTYYITVNGLTLDQALNEAHRKSRVGALGSVNNAATRDRNM